MKKKDLVEKAHISNFTLNNVYCYGKTLERINKNNTLKIVSL